MRGLVTAAAAMKRAQASGGKGVKGLEAKVKERSGASTASKGGKGDKVSKGSQGGEGGNFGLTANVAESSEDWQAAMQPHEWRVFRLLCLACVYGALHACIVQHGLTETQPGQRPGHPARVPGRVPGMVPGRQVPGRVPGPGPGPGPRCMIHACSAGCSGWVPGQCRPNETVVYILRFSQKLLHKKSRS